jgi:hypothetical protein
MFGDWGSGIDIEPHLPIDFAIIVLILLGIRAVV